MVQGIKTTPNQKVIKVIKSPCDKSNLYARYNLEAMRESARHLDAGAFKLWIYIGSNQPGYEFALSSSECGKQFGIKIKQYNNAVSELIEKGYLVAVGGNKYEFREIPVDTKGNNAVITNGDNAVDTQGNKGLSPKVIRNTTPDNTTSMTENITGVELSPKVDNIPASKSPQREDFIF